MEEEIKHERHSSMYPAASFQLIIAMGIGTVLSKLLSLTGMTFPIYIGAMIAAAASAIWANTAASSRYIWARSTTSAASACRSSLAWHDHPEDLAAGRAGSAAGGAAGRSDPVHDPVFFCDRVQRHGPRLRRGRHRFRHLRLRHGCHPQRAMANMQAVCDKYSPSVKAYLLIPLVGSLFADFINSLVITVFINFI